MNTNRLSKTIAAALNAQMTKEAHASQRYCLMLLGLTDKDSLA